MAGERRYNPLLSHCREERQWATAETFFGLFFGLLGDTIQSAIESTANSPKTEESIDAKLMVPYLSQTIVNLHQAHQALHDNYKKIEDTLDTNKKAELKKYRKILSVFLCNLEILEARIAEYRRLSSHLCGLVDIGV